ncbi:MAG: type VI secretion system contractile sheath small subunit, partial [Gammaproteobacteria bacterium]|nr:type VI secretion system contractile sheath small subunit [Gammaproteobacteria bacterium]
KDRKFSQIDRDNFNEILGKISPSLELKVANTIADDDSETSVDLKFSNMEDFEPHKIVDQVPALKNLLETRNKLRDLLTKADRSEELENILEDVLSNTEALQTLSDELGVGKEDSKEGEE